MLSVGTLCKARNVFLSVSSAIKPPVYTPRTFSILSNVNRNLIENFKPFQNVKFFDKGTIKFNLNPLRKQVTIPVNLRANQKSVGLWLLICSGMVFTAVSLGGYTRLTESGLSMVNWRFAFENYPTSEEKWIAEFEKYQEYPEFKQLKRNLTLDEFKTIWKTEYIHRNWGRFLGLMFALPAASFWFKGYFLPPMKKRILVFGSLIVAQGLMGWYMVKSGLEDRFHKETDVPRVSQYRLAAHLGLALTLFTGFLWTGLDLLLPAKSITLEKSAKKLRIMAHSCKGLVFLTALSGAFVAGLDAGLVYNSFPKMGDKWIPDDVMEFTPFYKNFTENPTTVQFDHRILGISTFSLIMATWALSKKYKLAPRMRIVANAFAIAACLQVILGVSTLVHYVPVSQAVAHQSGSLVLLTMAVWFSHELNKLKYIPK